MKSLKTIILTSILVIFAVSYGCDSMEDNFKQYIEEYNYSGKIENLRVIPGYERVVLTWDNPKDQKSKTIRIVYGEDSTVVSYDTLVDSVSIEGLTAGTGYEFIVYTLDMHNNLSVPTYITAFPVSQAFVESLTPPMVVVQTIGADQFISIMGTSNVLMSFSGNVKYTITGPDNLVLTDEIYLGNFVGKSQVDIPVASLIPIPFLPLGEYTFDFNVTVWPIQGNLVSIDEVPLSNNQKINVEPVKINLMTIPGTITDQHNVEGKEGILMLVDGNPGSKYLCSAKTTWMMWKMDREFLANMYELTSANDSADRDPKSWIVEGSNDGSNWTTLDQQSGVQFTTRFQKKTYSLPSSTPYSHYRLRVTENNGSNIFQLAEWTLFYDSAL